MEDQLYGVAIIPFVLPVVSALKRAGLPDAWAPLASMAVGILFSFVIDAAYGGFTPEAVISAVLHGLVAGTSASGLYSGLRQLSEPSPPKAPKAAATVEPPQVPHSPIVPWAGLPGDPALMEPHPATFPKG